MSDVVLDQLNMFLSTLSVSSSMDPLTGAHTFLITPAQDQLPSIVESVIETILTPGNIDLSTTLKDVRFSDVTSTEPFGGLPILNILTAGIVNDPPGALQAPGTANTDKWPVGVGGLIAGVTGTVPIPIPTSVPKPIAVALNVRWSIRDDQGNPVFDVTSTLGMAAPSQSAEIVPTLGNEYDALTIALSQEFVELTANLPPVVNRKVEVSICLTAADGITGNFRASTGWVQLASFTIVFPVIPIPTIAVFFSNDNYKGYAFVAVPTSSPIDEPTLLSTLNTLSSTLNKIANVGLNPTLLLFGQLQSVLSALGTARRIVFRKTDGMTNISSVNFQHGSAGDPKGEDANDVLSSMLLIGVRNRSIQCFNDSDYKSDEGKFTLLTDTNMISLVPNLKGKNPATNPPNMLHVDHAPGGWNDDVPIHKVRSFGDEMTSFRFF